MGVAYANYNDAFRRLHNSICFWDKEPVLVRYPYDDTKDKDKVNLFSLKDQKYLGEGKKFNITDPSFSDATPTLGYCFVGQEQAVYVSRRPDRGLGQGFSADNAVVKPYCVRWTISSRDMHKCIKGEHPTFYEAQQMLKDGIGSVPFHRYGALKKLDKKITALYWRDNLIATLGKYGWEVMSDKMSIYSFNRLKKLGVPL